jgi:peptide/nickel transport system substrate-binding protein
MIDRQALANVVYKGAALPNFTVLTPATWQNDARQIYAGAYPAYEAARKFDEANAKRLVEASGYKGQEIVLAISAGEEATARVAQLVQQQAKNAGLTLVIKPMQPLAFSEAQYDASKRAGIDLFIGTSFNAVQDPLEPTGFTYLPGAFYNLTGYEDAKVTQLITDSRQSFDAAERAKMFVEMQTIYEKSNAVIPLLSLNTVTFLNKRLGGAVTSFAYLTMPGLVSVGAAK